MTTLAYTDNVLAFDSRVTCGGIIVSDSAVKGLRTDKYLTACAGHSAYADAFLEWVVNGLDPLRVPKTHDNKTEEIVGVVIDRKGFVTDYREGLSPLRPGKLKFYAEGSGRDIALGAMYAGASAEEAVRIASRLDICTGGRVRAVSFKDSK